jgi:hypothetical protein
MVKIYWIIEISEKNSCYSSWVNETAEVMLFNTKKEALNEIKKETLKKFWNTRITKAKVVKGVKTK